MLGLRSFSLLMAFVLLPTFMGGTMLWPIQAEAHKDHAGSMTQFMKKKELLRALLPADARLVKRKETLSSAAAGWAKEMLGIDLDNKVHTYYRASDHTSGRILGGAIIMKYAYRHGEVMLAVGIDAGQKVTAVAIQAVSEKYIPDFRTASGVGLLSGYDDKTVQDLAKIAATAAPDKPSRFLNTKLAETAAMIAAFLHGADNQ